MDKNMRDIFVHVSALIEYTDKAVLYFRRQNYSKALHYNKLVIGNISKVIDAIIEKSKYFYSLGFDIDASGFNSMLYELLQVQEIQDYVYLGDLYELKLLPLLITLQETIIQSENKAFSFDEAVYEDNIVELKHKNYELAAQIIKEDSPLALLNKEYKIEYTSCGLMTLAIEKKGKRYYLHSNNRVLQEAVILADQWQNDDVCHYIIYGLGLGYHIKELNEISPESIIDVYECDLNIIHLACAFTDLKKLIINPNVNIIYDPDFKKLSRALNHKSEDMSFVIHFPSLINIANQGIRSKLEEYFMQQSSVHNQLKFMNDNFRSNIAHYDKPVDELKTVFGGKDLYIIAAGPSLDKNYQELSKIGKKGIILSTGTVLKKLIHAGINPDYFIVSESSPISYAQVEGIEMVEIPLIGLSTTYKAFMQNCSGKKYLACQKDYEKAETYAKERGFNLYRTGGSVSTIALDIGIRLGCRRIIAVGLDLAFTDQVDHATGTETREIIQKEFSIPVEDINGNTVFTSRNLNIYRQWIEKRIAEEKDIEFIDATEGGAKIHGMKLMSLSEVVEEV